jgi:hypothetical protein
MEKKYMPTWVQIVRDQARAKKRNEQVAKAIGFIQKITRPKNNRQFRRRRNCRG